MSYGVRTPDIKSQKKILLNDAVYSVANCKIRNTGKISSYLSLSCLHENSDCHFGVKKNNMKGLWECSMAGLCRYKELILSQQKQLFIVTAICTLMKLLLLIPCTPALQHNKEILLISCLISLNKNVLIFSKMLIFVFSQTIQLILHQKTSRCLHLR